MWSMYDDIRLHVARSYTSSADSPFSLISSYTLSNHLLLGLPLFLLPCTFITIALVVSAVTSKYCCPLGVYFTVFMKARFMFAIIVNEVLSIVFRTGNHVFSVLVFSPDHSLLSQLHILLCYIITTCNCDVNF